MNKIIFTIIFNSIFSVCSSVLAQAPPIQWARCYGGSFQDYGRSVVQSVNGDYFVTGYTLSNDSQVSGLHSVGFPDYWVIRIDSIGNLLWQKCLGGTSDEYAYSIDATSDGGCIVTGVALSHDGDVTGYFGNSDYWVIKLDSGGSIQWKHCYGGTSQDGACSVKQTRDGGYIISGYAESGDGEVIGQHGVQDYWLLKLDSTGNIQWAKTYGGSSQEAALSVSQTFDSGYILAGWSTSTDSDVTGNHGGRDCWIVKTDSVGTIQWENSFGSTGNEEANAVIQTQDSGYAFAGKTGSFNNGDVSGNHGGEDFWLVKLDAAGTLQWQKCLGGSSHDIAYSILQTSDKGYVVAGSTSSIDGDVTGLHSNGNATDFWLAKTDSAGSIQWEECLGGTGAEIAYDIHENIDGSYILTGSTNSTNGDVSGNHSIGFYDYWVVKLASPAPLNIVENRQQLNFYAYPNPAQEKLFIISNEQMQQIKITDALGKILFSQPQQNKEKEIDIHTLAKGIYFLQVQTENGNGVKQIVNN
ncbi:MAG: T9SS type A sorting domain-containing protein [Bacteroidota bacterium]